VAQHQPQTGPRRPRGGDLGRQSGQHVYAQCLGLRLVGQQRTAQLQEERRPNGGMVARAHRRSVVARGQTLLDISDRRL